MALDTLRIAGLVVDCVVGVYPHERNASQPLQVDLEMRLNTEAAALSERVSSTVNYASVAAQLVFLLRSCRFRLLETAAHALSRYLLSPPGPGERRAQVDQLRLTLTKPGALRGFAAPSLDITRDASWADCSVEERPFGRVDVIHETRGVGIYRLNIAPGRSIPLHRHQEMKESEMVLSEGLLCQGKPVLPGTVHRWPRGAAHGYENRSEHFQSILCVDAPRFLPHDEIPADGEPADVPPEPPWGPVVGA